VDELRTVDYKASGTLQRGLELAASLTRKDFDGLLGAMVQAGLIAIEEAEYEKDGEVRKFRKVRLTDAGRELRAGTAIELLISDGLVEEFGGQVEAPSRTKKTAAKASDLKTVQGKAGPAKSGSAKAAQTLESAPLTVEGELLALRIKEWRAVEAKRLRVPAYVVLHDRTIRALAQSRPGNPKALLAIDGMGPAKVEKFGEAILGLCARVPTLPR
jgi:superfamily II DNA helicase RecQ